MGNDTSKATVENQQLIMQLQQQILNNQHVPVNNVPYHLKQPMQNSNHFTQYSHQLPQTHNNLHQQIPQSIIQQSTIPRVNSINPNADQNISIPHIIQNKHLLQQIDANPIAKRKLLEKLLVEQRHVMSTQQIQKITNMLNQLPPLQNETLQSPHYAMPQNIGAIETGNMYGTAFHQGTTKQDTNSRALQTTQQFNDAKILSTHYKSEAEAEEAAFKREEQKRRNEFQELQRQRKAQYQAKLLELDKNNIDALKIFQLKPNYTLDELKAAYKKQAMKTHPDKPTGNKEQFQLITQCYMSLLEKYKNRETDKPFNDLRDASKIYIEEQQKSRTRNKYMNNGEKVSSTQVRDTSGPVIAKDRFDVKVFNKIYEQNKLWDSNDDGYDDFMKNEKKEENEPPTEIFGNNFNMNVFNSTFEDYKDKLTAQNGMQIQEYTEPCELVSCSTGFTEIDVFSKKVDDFSKPLPIAGAGSKNELAYTDLKTAYTARGAFIDPSKVEYKTYNSVDELKRDRSNIRYDMTPEQQREFELRKHREIEEEEIRQTRIRERDHVIANSYGKLHEKMLGYRGNAPS